MLQRSSSRSSDEGNDSQLLTVFEFPLFVFRILCFFGNALTPRPGFFVFYHALPGGSHKTARLAERAK